MDDPLNAVDSHGESFSISYFDVELTFSQPVSIKANRRRLLHGAIEGKDPHTRNP